MVIIREVWCDNWAEEMRLIARVANQYPYISVDTEFPGFILKTDRTASEYERYKALKFNVDSLKLIQVGLSFSDGHGNFPEFGGVWQFNFCEFDPSSDTQSSDSIDLLKKNGTDFEKNKTKGINFDNFCHILFTAGLISNPRVCWLTFHGGYDFAYLIKLMGGKKLPKLQSQFLELVDHYFCNFYDLKSMVKLCGVDADPIGLNKLATVMKVNRFGTSHQAGSDSMLTTSVFGEMRKNLEKNGFNMDLSTNPFIGYLYGMERKVSTDFSYYYYYSLLSNLEGALYAIHM